MFRIRKCFKFYHSHFKVNFSANYSRIPTCKNKCWICWYKKQYFHHITNRNTNISSNAIYERFDDNISEISDKNTNIHPYWSNTFLAQLETSTEIYFNYIEACVSSGFLQAAIDSTWKRASLKKLPCDIKIFEFLIKSIHKDDSLNRSTKMSFVVKIVESMKILQIEVSDLLLAYQIAITQKYSYKFEKKRMIDSLFTLLRHKGFDVIKCHQLLPVNTPVEEDFLNAWQLHDPQHYLRHQQTTSPEMLRHQQTTSPEVEQELERQLDMEMEGFSVIPSVTSDQCEEEERSEADDLHRKWEFSLLCHFRQRRFEMQESWKQSRYHQTNSIVPFLHLLPDEDYVKIMLRSLHALPLAGKITTQVCSELGEAVFATWVARQHPKHQIASFYRDYLDAINAHPNTPSRDLWRDVERRRGLHLSRDTIEPWNSRWRFRVGMKLLELMVSQLTLDLTGSDQQVPSAYFRHAPALFNSLKPWGKKVHSMTIPHPRYVTIAHRASHFHFDTHLLPTTVPAKPWSSPRFGGFLTYPTKFVRSNSSPSLTDDVSSVCDAINVISSVPWKLNQRVLDIQLKMFRSGGDEKLSIPPPSSSAALPTNITAQMMTSSWQARRKARASLERAKKMQSEMHSLYCAALYKFTIAAHFRDRTFWLPHSLDFRGRAYPVPPHFNYMGNDSNRALFQFAEGKKLGAEGLRWLKVHLINLTDLKKAESNQSRLDFADEIMDEVFDSADRPLDGRRWWMTSEEPWQTLSACIELATALRSPNPEDHVSHLPIYQDGSCNGLQHYAAIGRDVIGAQQVNLSPADKPQDIYSGVAANVEMFRRQDAENGFEIAKLLEGYVTRKVVKQTVMTTVYGVTRYGGGLQIRRKLLDEDEFPKERAREAASYLVLLVFRGLDVMFTGASEIKRWLREIARIISRGGEVVEWQTPLGLHVHQPYYKSSHHRIPSSVSRLALLSTTNQKPNVLKQQNAFPPNFIHSLDASHMMLTATECHRLGLTFVSVHDCYWTHACDVDTMNRVCRERFVHLHSQPILESLVDHLRKVFIESGKLDARSADQLNELFSNIPERGEFDLNEVNKSTYFFC